MKSLRILAMPGVLVACALAGSAAWAFHNGGFEHQRPDRQIGVFMSHPTFGGSRHAAAFALAPQVTHQVTPQVIVVRDPSVCSQHNVAGSPGVQPAYWYYCADPQGYYPHLTQCQAGWQMVAPLPPPR